MPENFRVNITRRACADLEAIHEYIEQRSPQNARTVSERLINAIDSLDLFPERYPVHTGRSRPSEAVRRMPVPPFLIYYRIDAPTRSIDILTVRHGHRRQPRRL